MKAKRRYQPEPQQVYKYPDPQRPGRVRFDIWGDDLERPIVEASVRVDAATAYLEVRLWEFLDMLPPEVAGYRRPRLLR